MSSNVGLSDIEKDRRTRMVTSSFKAPAKKDGAGGSYTWGGATDVTDYAPVGTSVSKVSVAPAPVSAADRQSSAPPTQKLYLKDTRHFPDLGVKPAPVAVKWGPQPPPTPVQITEEALRPGTQELFDAQHPRNAFARRARSAEGRSAGAQHQVAIDWSAAGTSAVTQALLETSSGNAAHVSPFNIPRAGAPTLKQLVEQPQPAQYAASPQIMKGQAKQQFRQPPGKVLQARAR
jgi:hypothetical protein